MPPIDPADYYAERDVEHSAQGDIHLDLVFVAATAAEVDEAPRGARKRPDEAEDVAVRPPLRAPGIVCSYTCGFTAQPPGQRGYSHPFRLVAPIMSLTALKALGVKPNELRKLSGTRASSRASCISPRPIVCSSTSLPPTRSLPATRPCSFTGRRS